MSRDSSPADKLSRLAGADATSVRALRDLFFKKARGSQPVRVSRVHIPAEVYNRYLKLYELSRQLVDALEQVLEDAEHQLIMDEARGRGYRLPDIDRFSRELAAYREFLEEMDPYDVSPREGGYIKMPADEARTLHHLVNYNCFMVARIFQGCFKTDYMKHFGFLRENGLPYDGATALQETMDVMIAMVGTAMEIDRQVEAGRQHEDWPKLVM